MCTAMLYDPEEKAKEEAEKKAAALTHQPEPVTREAKEFAAYSKIYERFMRLKQFVLLKGWRKNDNDENKKSSFLSFLFFW